MFPKVRECGWNLCKRSYSNAILDVSFMWQKARTHMITLGPMHSIHFQWDRGFINVLNRGASGFVTRAKTCRPWGIYNRGFTTVWTARQLGLTPGQRLALLGGSGGIHNRDFFKVLNRKATGFDTWAKNWIGPEGNPNECWRHTCCACVRVTTWPQLFKRWIPLSTG